MYLPACPVTRGRARGGPEVGPPTQGGGILFPQLPPTGLHIEIRCAYAAAACPGRNYAQAISAWTLLHPAVPLSPFCRKCNIRIPIGASNFSLVYNTHLALGDHPLAVPF